MEIRQCKRRQLGGCWERGKARWKAWISVRGNKTIKTIKILWGLASSSSSSSTSTWLPFQLPTYPTPPTLVLCTTLPSVPNILPLTLPQFPFIMILTLWDSWKEYSPIFQLNKKFQNYDIIAIWWRKQEEMHTRENLEIIIIFTSKQMKVKHCLSILS